MLFLLYTSPLMLSFLSNKNGLLFPLYMIDLAYVHYRALRIILFYSFSLACYTFLSKQSHDALCDWEELPQHASGSHLLFSVEILLRKPKCLKRSWQHIGWQRSALMFSCLVAPASSPQPACARVFSLSWRLWDVLATLLWVHVSASMKGLHTLVLYEHNVNIVHSELL